MQQSTPASSDDSLAALLDAEERSARARHRRLAIAAAITLAALAAAVWLLRPGDENGIRFETAEVRRGDLVVHVTATGTLEPVNQVEVGTEISGTIEVVLVDYNDLVRAGDELARLDTEQLDARLRQSEAALALARARVLEAEATVTETANRLRRTEDLLRKGMSSREELDTSTAAHARATALLAVAEAQVAQAQAQLDADRRTREKAVIRAPIDGIVLERKVEPGQTVAASLQTPVLFKLDETLTQMDLHVDVDEADVGSVAVGQGAEFTVDAYPDRTFPARIEQVRFAPQTVEGVVTYETLLAVDNSELLLRPGMTATAEILVERIEDALLVPNAALRFSPPRAAAAREAGGRGLVGMLLPRAPGSRRDNAGTERAGDARVWLLADGEPAAVSIETGASDGAQTQVLSGDLKAGQQVLVDSVMSGRGR
ncbi:MAG: efflux RND transporter periplasmic adaptor subunit [Thiohalocapsa sp.]|nr:efflux RND transporter periplasmic adaptor subunit [Thiohalocapsa sp.]